MTDRANALVVVLNRDTRVDDVEQLISAISLLRGVCSVSANISDITQHVAWSRARNELGDKLWKVLYPQD